MATVYEHDPEAPLEPGDVDGMAQFLIDAENDGWEGEHVFDGSVEDPPHPFWDAERGCCKPD